MPYSFSPVRQSFLKQKANYLCFNHNYPDLLPQAYLKKKKTKENRRKLDSALKVVYQTLEIFKQLLKFSSMGQNPGQRLMVIDDFLITEPSQPRDEMSVSEAFHQKHCLLFWVRAGAR